MSGLYKDFYLNKTSQGVYTFTHKTDSYNEPNWFYYTEKQAQVAIDLAYVTKSYPKDNGTVIWKTSINLLPEVYWSKHEQ